MKTDRPINEYKPEYEPVDEPLDEPTEDELNLYYESHPEEAIPIHAYIGDGFCRLCECETVEEEFEDCGGRVIVKQVCPRCGLGI